MSFEAASITGTIDIGNAPTIRSFRQVEAESKKMGKGVENAMGQAGTDSAKAWLKGINSEFGKKSVSGQFLKLAMGGGAIAGANMAAHEVEALTGRVAELSAAFRNGEIKAGAMGAELLREIPIFGTLVRAADNMREAVTGEGAALDKQVKKWKDGSDQMAAGLEYRKKMMQEGTQAAVDWAVAVGKLDEKLAILRAPPGQEGTAAVKLSVEDMLAAARKRYEDAAHLTVKGGDFMAAHAGSELYSNDLGELPAMKAKVESLTRATHEALVIRNAAVEKFNALKSDYDAPLQDKKLNATSEQVEAARSRFHGADQEFQALEKQRLAAVNALTVLARAADNAQKRFEEERKRAMDVATEEQEKLQREFDAGPLGRNRLMLGPSLDEKGRPVEKVDAFEEYKKRLDRIELPRLLQLPNPRLQAEEAFGPRIISNADLPAPQIQAAQETAKNTRETADAAKQLLLRSSAGPLRSGLTIDTVTMP